MSSDRLWRYTVLIVLIYCVIAQIQMPIVANQKAYLAAWVNYILRSELSYLLLFTVDNNYTRRR